ncbi:MAG: insulinase family protein [Anaerovibrio sp.]|uniref:insulinase family protein n=1 Tax=Anaerovibrio sp. TaxID=1872532 RepID=UPI0025EF7B4D|nr:insulinase family protein [Anaerovibrio sp.]MCR5175336.1 insulinase family protein [Anaerovibrio sp.]
MDINDVIHGFKLIKKDHVAEAGSDTFEFIHEKSGARLLYLQNKDDNKVFSIAFRTPPEDDTGVAHIIEHSTLCGSRKFPLKEPFVELVKGSLNTFLNAMTYPDKTVYPVASCNDKDFHNLMDVYLDAVFYPAMLENHEILMQEGWHYEIEKPEDPLTYSGVVYNEMKGALSSPEDLLQNEIMRALYPDTTYANESGGNPEAIPELTYESFKEFHRKYYSPANSYIYLYGDMDIVEQLKFIDEEYLSHFDVVDVDSVIHKQKAFDEIKDICAEYPVGAEETTEAKTFLAYSVVAGSSDDMEEYMAMSILEDALIRHQAAPLRKAIIDAGICKDISSYYEGEILQPFFTIELNGSEEKYKEKFQQIVRDTLCDIVKNGIDKELLEGTLNHMEFRLREADYGTAPKGLIYNLSVLKSWLYDKDPLRMLRYEDLLESLRKKLSTGYYEGLIQKNLLDNRFGAVVVLKPNNTMAAARTKKMEAHLAQLKEKMTAAEIDDIISATASLKRRQQTPDTPEALATIPLLKISDINPKSRTFPMEEKEWDGIKVLCSDVETNGIVYYSLYFDIDTVPQELLPYVFLYNELMGQVDTASRTYAELTKKMLFYTGGMGGSIEVFDIKDHPDEYRALLRMTSKVFYRNLPIAMDLMCEIINESLFDDSKRIRELMVQLRAEVEMEMLQSSVSVARTRLSSFISKDGVFDEIGALSLYQLIKDITDDFDNRFEDFKAKLYKVKSLLFSKKHLTVGLTLPKKDYGMFEAEVKKLSKALEGNKTADEAPRQVYDLPVKGQKEGLVSSSQVQYVAKGANLINLGYEVTGHMRVMETMLKYEYFWIKIRVQGGAYGAMTSIKNNGNVIFVSYRDPKLKETLDVFNGTADFLRHFDADEREMTKYIIGTISGVDMPLPPKTIGNVAQGMYFRRITNEMRQKSRDEILSTTPEIIRGLAPAVDDCMKADNICVFGNENVITDNRDIFDKLTRIMD